MIEADEYDTAFFDKRSKFIHYRPRTLIINNIEFDHADIFPDLAAIQRQFHHLVRTVPAGGLIVRPTVDVAVDATLALGCWTPVTSIGAHAADWRYVEQNPDCSHFTVQHLDAPVGEVRWQLIGHHNAMNALAAVAAAQHVGVAPQVACTALGAFEGVKRRLEVVGVVDDITVYDDFAHHPTAIATTLNGLRRRVGPERIVAVFEPRSNTMRLGCHKDTLAAAFADADDVVLLQPTDVNWDVDGAFAATGARHHSFSDIDAIVAYLKTILEPRQHCLFMSNGGFGGIHGKLLNALRNR